MHRALGELQRRAKNNPAEASPQSAACVNWGSWFLAPTKRSLNVCSGAALHKTLPMARAGCCGAWHSPGARKSQHEAQSGLLGRAGGLEQAGMNA